jgi:hypothetical protein
MRIAQDVGGVVIWGSVDVKRVTSVQRECAVCMTEGSDIGDICFKSRDGSGDGGVVGLMRECR